MGTPVRALADDSSLGRRNVDPGANSLEPSRWSQGIRQHAQVYRRLNCDPKCLHVMRPPSKCYTIHRKKVITVVLDPGLRIDITLSTRTTPGAELARKRCAKSKNMTPNEYAFARGRNDGGTSGA